MNEENCEQFETKAREILALLAGAPPTVSIITHLMMHAYHKGRLDEMNRLRPGPTPNLGL